MSRFGEFLVREAGIPAERVQKALALQETMGDRLGSNLLEIGAVTQEKLLDSLGKFHNAPTISSLDLRRIPPVVLKQIPPKMAMRYKIIPFKLSGKTLFVASPDPGDLLIEDEISFISGSMVKTHVCLEVWVRLALEKYYGKPCSERLKILVRRMAGAKKQAADGPAGRSMTPISALPKPPPKPIEKPKAAPRPAEPEKADPLFIELSVDEMKMLGMKEGQPPPDDLAPPVQDHLPAPQALRDAQQIQASVPDEVPLEDQSFEAQAFADAVAEAEAMEDPLTDHSLPSDERLFLAADEFQQATMRDEIADVIFAFAEPYLKRRMMLINRKGKIVGWRGEGEGVDPKHSTVREIEIGEHEPSVFLGLKSAENFWSGPLPPMPPNQRMVQALGGTSSKDCLVLPITLRGKLVCFFYGDNLGDSVASAPIPDLRRLVGKAGIAFEVYILKNKIRLL